MSNRPASFIYNIEVLVEDNDHSAALVQLLQKLNSSGLTDYKILSGIQLGQQIDVRKKRAVTQQAVPIRLPEANEPAAATQQSVRSFESIHTIMKQNKLIRLIVNKGLGKKASIPCRIINLDEENVLVTVYHVDEKQVYTFRMNEIEDIIDTNT